MAGDTTGEHQNTTPQPSSASIYSVETTVTLIENDDNASIFSTETITGPPVVPKLPNPVPEGFDYTAFFAEKTAAQRALATWHRKEAARQEAEADAEAERTGVKRKWTNRKDSKRRIILKGIGHKFHQGASGEPTIGNVGGQAGIFW